MADAFTYRKVVYLHDITIFGNAYYASFFFWEGEAREAFFNLLVGDPKAVFDSGLKLVTLNASIEYREEVNLMDQLSIEVLPRKISVTTVELEFRFYKNGEPDLIARGCQRVGFVGKAGRPVPLPIELLTNGRRYLNPELLLQVRRIEQKIRWIQTNSLLK